MTVPTYHRELKRRIIFLNLLKETRISHCPCLMFLWIHLTSLSPNAKNVISFKLPIKLFFVRVTVLKIESHKNTTYHVRKSINYLFTFLFFPSCQTDLFTLCKEGNSKSELCIVRN